MPKPPPEDDENDHQALLRLLGYDLDHTLYTSVHSLIAAHGLQFKKTLETSETPLEVPRCDSVDVSRWKDSRYARRLYQVLQANVDPKEWLLEVPVVHSGALVHSQLGTSGELQKRQREQL